MRSAVAKAASPAEVEAAPVDADVGWLVLVLDDASAPATDTTTVQGFHFLSLELSGSW